MEIYSVMQSDGINFCGDVVSDSLNRAFRDEDNILDQKYKSKYVRNIITKYILTARSTTKTQFYENSLMLCAIFPDICIFFNHS